MLESLSGPYRELSMIIAYLPIEENISTAIRHCVRILGANRCVGPGFNRGVVRYGRPEAQSGVWSVVNR